MPKIVLISLIGALAGLDNSFFFNVMISRAIVLGPLFGFIIGDMKTGTFLGFIIEMLFSNVLYIGNFVPINISFFITIVMGSLYFTKSLYYEDSFIMIIFFVAYFISYIIKNIEIIFRTFNELVAEKIEELIIKKSFYNSIYLGILLSFFIFFTINFFILFFSIKLNIFVSKLVFFSLNYKVLLSLENLYKFLPIIGFSVMLDIFFIKKNIFDISSKFEKLTFNFNFKFLKKKK